MAVSKANYSLSGRDDLLLDSLRKYYAVPSRIDKIAPIINGESNISLRIIDHFVTSFAPTFGITCHERDKFTSVYESYKKNLKAFQGKYFSIFKRTNKINFEYQTGKCLTTTIAQLNFFKWILEYKILEKVEKHYDEICKDLSTKAVKKQKGSGSSDDVDPSGAGDSQKNTGQQAGDVGYTIRGKRDNSGDIDIIINIR